MNNLVERMNNSEVFTHLKPAEREALTLTGHRKVLQAEEILCHQGDTWPYVFWILEGQMRSYIISPDGRTFVTGVWKEGKEFWGHSLFDEKGMPSTTEAVSRTMGYLWDGEEALEVIFHNTNAVRALLRRQTLLVRGRREIIFNLAFNPVTSRVAKLIVGLFEDAENQTVQRELTLDEMAARIASSPEVVCRVLHQFHASGFLDMKRATITLHDRAALENLISIE